MTPNPKSPVAHGSLLHLVLSALAKGDSSIANLPVSELASRFQHAPRPFLEVIRKFNCRAPLVANRILPSQKELGLKYAQDPLSRSLASYIDKHDRMKAQVGLAQTLSGLLTGLAQVSDATIADLLETLSPAAPQRPETSPPRGYERTRRAFAHYVWKLPAREAFSRTPLQHLDEFLKSSPRSVQKPEDTQAAMEYEAVCLGSLFKKIVHVERRHATYLTETIASLVATATPLQKQGKLSCLDAREAQAWLSQVLGGETVCLAWLDAAAKYGKDQDLILHAHFDGLDLTNPDSFFAKALAMKVEKIFTGILKELTERDRKKFMTLTRQRTGLSEEEILEWTDRLFRVFKYKLSLPQ